MIKYVKIIKNKSTRRKSVFKTSFSKYLTAFVIIILVSFVILSSIITSMIRTFVSNDTEEKLEHTGTVIVDLISDNGLEELPRHIHEIALSIIPVVNFDTQFDVFITDRDGKIILSTVNIGTPESKEPAVNLTTGLGSIDVSWFETENKSGRGDRLVHHGNLDGYLSAQSVVYATPVSKGDIVTGYVMTLSSTAKEDRLVSITRRVVINSSIWVMLAAVIAAYFITERIVHPMRNMTSAAKKFAKGDFSARVTVYGHDEVSELGRAFNNMADSLESLEKMRNSFLANISHDLRTPMTTIAGFIDGINSGAIPPEKHEYYLGIISAEVHRLSRLVSQILDVSRLESGERKFNFTNFDVAEVARLILISFEQKIEDKRLDVEFDTENDSMLVRADQDAIYQVLYNLCHNAIKFSREGGKLRIRISRVALGKIRVAVFDEGQSISAEDTKMVFDRFYKTDKSRGLDKSGVGLGLYISKAIIDAHGEFIGVESVEDEGCEFYFTLKEGEQISKRKALPEQNN